LAKTIFFEDQIKIVTTLSQKNYKFFSL